MAASTANRVYPLTVTVPAGTLASAPLSVPFVTEDNVIVSIEIEVPPGHNGLTGIRVMKGDVQLIPWGANSWITANDYVHTFPVNDYVPTSDVKVQAYNTGTYPHNFFLRMTMTLYTPPSAGLGSTEAAALAIQAADTALDPLSPDALIGNAAADALTSGAVSPADLAAIDATAATAAPVPSP
jgi:hypothetical protein